MIKYVRVLRMTDHVLSNDARWQNVIFSSFATIGQVLELS
jgi:hypothetical protein